MGSFIVGVVVGIVVGWHLPQPEWAKNALTKLKETFNKTE